MELRILGSLEVSVDGGKPLALGGLRQRALLAVLILHANEVVSTDRLVDQLWGEHPPATALHTVQVFISRLRGALASASTRLATSPPGYVLKLSVGELDAERCERLYADARAAMAAGNAVAAASLLRDALGRWRGPPLAEFTYEPFAQATIARLDELRAGCREELIEAQLTLGSHAEVVPDLEALVRDQPFRERPCGQLMLALYRCGRQADALAVYQQARRMLVDELAVEPSSALRELEQAILRQDVALAAPTAPPTTPPPPAPVLFSPSETARGSLESQTPTSARDGDVVTIVRKTATVLLVRLTTSGRTDPEVARNLIATARAAVEQIIAYHGGTITSGLAGELVGLYGLPLTKEDDAMRALRAARELHARVATISPGEPSNLELRIGVDTGEIVAQAPDDVYGAPLGGAADLMLVAQNGDILLSDLTRRLASDAIRVERTRDGTAWRLLDLVASRPAIRQDGKSPMVGRDNEFAAARTAFARAARTGTTNLLTVIGDPGIGKSRLAEAVIAEFADQATVLIGRCLSYGDGIAFWPMREALTEIAGGESRDAIRELLGDIDGAEAVADIIAATLGLSVSEGTGEQVPWAFRTLLETLAQERAVILVIEDVHWAESPLLDLVEYLIDWAAAPMLVLCLARPELLEVRPGWGGGHQRVTSLVLDRLEDAAGRRLLESQLGPRSLSIAETDQILKTAEGNPLFVEQLMATSIEEPHSDREHEIPATIQALLAARLDRLGPGERAFIERAAIIGREFWPEAVVELLPSAARPTAAQHLRTLVRRELLEPDRSTLAGEEQVRFHHILIRDVAYRSTPKTLRSELHERLADWIAQRGAGYEEFVGHHLEQAYRYRSELGHTDASVRALASRASDWLSTAGRRALSRGDSNSSVNLLRRAADLADLSGESRPEVLLDLGSALSDSGDFPSAEPVLQAALDQSRAMGAAGLSARALIELSYWQSRADPSARVEEMLMVADQAIAVFTPDRDESGLSRAWLHIAWAHWIRSHSAAMEPALERALTHAEHAGERRQRSHILSDLARATVIGPRPVEDGIRRCEVLLERAHGDVMPTAFTEAMLAVLLAMNDRAGEARDRWQASKRRLTTLGLGFDIAVAQMYYAFIELLAGCPERAEPEVADACVVFERIGERGRLSTATALLARLLYAQGRYAESERYSQSSRDAASADDVVSQVLWRGVQAKLLAHSGERPGAEKLVNSAVAQARSTDFLMLHGDALTDQADVLVILGRRQKAAHALQQALAVYERKGIRPSADRARRAYRSLTPAPASSP